MVQSFRIQAIVMDDINNRSDLEVSGEDDDEEADVDAGADADAVAETGANRRQNEDENSVLSSISVPDRKYLPKKPNQR